MNNEDKPIEGAMEKEAGIARSSLVVEKWHGGRSGRARAVAKAYLCSVAYVGAWAAVAVLVLGASFDQPIAEFVMFVLVCAPSFLIYQVYRSFVPKTTSFWFSGGVWAVCLNLVKLLVTAMAPACVPLLVLCGVGLSSTLASCLLVAWMAAPLGAGAFYLVQYVRYRSALGRLSRE